MLALWSVSFVLLCAWSQSYAQYERGALFSKLGYPPDYHDSSQDLYTALHADTPRIQLRLAGENRKHNEGRVEVFYNGEWGTVCDDEFANQEAQVVCRELGYFKAVSWFPSSKYGSGEGRIWFDNVHCTGKERSLAQCKSNGLGVSDCTHTEDVGVVCSDTATIIKMSSCRFQESNSEVRIEHSLNKNEEEFRVRRRNTVQQCLKRHGIDCRDKVPNIALLGSGGGERAMVGLLGSLDQLEKTGLLDSILYLSGVSGSTWCMASIYQEPDWSTKLESVKNRIVQRLSGPKVSWRDASAKLQKYYNEKDIFSMTDFWAAMVVTTYVKEIDEQPFTKYWNQQSKDPFPIYTSIDKQCKQRNEGDPWFEFSPYEAGYSLIGAFVGVSSFGSQFEKGSMIKKQPEIDMLYLQGLCGSALADGDEIKKFIWQKIYDFFNNLRKFEEMGKEDPDSQKVFQVLLDLVDMNLYVLDGRDPSALEKSISTTLKELTGGKHQLIFPLDFTDKEAAKLYMKNLTMYICNDLSVPFSLWPFGLCYSILRSMVQWIWGRKYDFLHNMAGEPVPAPLVESKTRDFEDAGLLLNSPYFSVLRKERDIDLIISLDFSDGDPFTTVKEAAKMCRELNISFPEVIIPSEDSKKPKDFYVFKGQHVPTVIHIPLFNVDNCGEDIDAWRTKYKTFQGAYSAEMITDLLEVAGKNILNNKAKLVDEISAIVWRKIFRRYHG